MLEEWLQLLDKENAATYQTETRLLVCMFHLTTAIYWLDEAPINSMKYQLRAASHLLVQYEEIVEPDTIYYGAGGVLEATRQTVSAIEVSDEFEQVTHLHKALESLYGSWYYFKYGKEVTTSG